jgi:hypothetical protein
MGSTSFGIKLHSIWNVFGNHTRSIWVYNVCVLDRWKKEAGEALNPILRLAPLAIACTRGNEAAEYEQCIDQAQVE